MSAMSRTAKIHLFPRHIREELNHRIECSLSAPELTAWLNSLPAVQTICNECYNGDPVTIQNVSSWRRTGFLEWYVRQQFYDRVHDIVADAAELEAANINLTEHCARLVGIHFALSLTPATAPSWNNVKAAECNFQPGEPMPRVDRSNPLYEGVCEHNPDEPPCGLPLPDPRPDYNHLKALATVARAIIALRRSDLEAALAKEKLQQNRAKPRDQSPSVETALPVSPPPSDPLLPLRPSVQNPLTPPAEPLRPLCPTVQNPLHPGPSAEDYSAASILYGPPSNQAKSSYIKKPPPPAEPPLSRITPVKNSSAPSVEPAHQAQSR